jgi:hypothetical protein
VVVDVWKEKVRRDASNLSEPIQAPLSHQPNHGALALARFFLCACVLIPLEFLQSEFVSERREEVAQELSTRN